MKSEFTPGPWTIGTDLNSPCIYTSDGVCTVAMVFGPNQGTEVSQEQLIADARLIAAAPELLDFVKLYPEWYNFGLAEDVPKMKVAAQAVLNKATGNQ